MTATSGRRPLPLLAALATVLATALAVLGVPASAVADPTAPPPTVQPTVQSTVQGISGVITSDGERGPAAYQVVAVPSGSEWMSYLTDTGAFRHVLEPGTYWVRFSGSRDVAPRWWGGATTRGASTPVVVEPGEFTTLEVDLPPDDSGSVSGTVAGATTATTVEVSSPDATYPDGRAVVGLARVRDDGTFRVDGVPPGAYRVRVVDPVRRLEGWWRSVAGDTTAAASEADATPVTVEPGQDTAGVAPTALRSWGVVTGTVTRGDGRPRGRVAVSLYEHTRYGYWEQRGEAVTDVRGRYSIPAAAGVHRVRFRADRDGYWDGAGGTTAVWGEGGTVRSSVGGRSVVDAVLEPAAVEQVRAPQVLGVRQVGRTLTVVRGAYYPARTVETVQWTRDGRPVPGATGRRYVLGPADFGRRVDVVVQAGLSGFEGRTSVLQDGPTQAARFRVLSPAVVRGPHRVGGVLRVVLPRLAVRPANLRLRWQRNGYDIPGATGRTYRVRPADRDNFLSVVVVARRPGYRTETWETARRGPVPRR